ncbi:hydroxymethylglutaryl-CoA lyase [Jhaorihella thermophila]
MAGSAEVLKESAARRGCAMRRWCRTCAGMKTRLPRARTRSRSSPRPARGFSKANINATIEESVERFKPIIAAARHIDLPVRGYISCVTDCPYDGPTPPGKVAELADILFGLGCYEISLGDTIGQGTPETISRMLLAVRDVVPVTRLAGHYHDTAGRALANIDASLSLGVRVFDAAVGGLGGCPYAPGAAGNVATEAVAAHLERLGYETGLDMAVLQEAAAMARAMRGL